MEVTVLKYRPAYCKLHAVATVNGEVACEATLKCMLVDRDPVAEPSEAPADAAVGTRDE